MMKYANRITKAQWFAFGLVTLQWFLLTATKPFLYSGLRWYHTLSMSLVCFLLMKRKFAWRALGKYRWIFSMYGLSWLLLFVTQQEIALTVEGIFKSFVAISTFVLLIPTLSHPMARKMLFFGLLYTVIMRCLVVFNYTQSEILYSELSGFGKDKNFSGMLIAMGVAMLTSFVLSRNIQIRYRLMCGGFTLYLLFIIFSTGSRTASISVFISILVIIFLYLLLEKGVLIRLRTIIFSVIVFVVSLYALQILTGKYDLLHENYVRLTEFLKGERTDINSRIELFDLSVKKIKENPILGNGYGSSEHLSGFWRLTHNTYVAEWIEFGLFGILSLVLFILFSFKEIKYQFTRMKLGQGHKFDYALSLSGLPFIVMLGTLNLSTITIFMICLFAAYEYERYFNIPLKHRVV